MRVALFAPKIAPEWGGVWQFTQLVLRELSGIADYGLVGSRRLIDELATKGESPPAASTICYDDFCEDGETLFRSCERLADELDAAGTDLVHVPIQLIGERPVADRFPYILNPHDYQHEYFPDFFAPEEIAARRRIWYPSQRNAAARVCHSGKTGDDALRFLDVPEERVFYAPYGPLKSFDLVDRAVIERTVERFSLPERYLFYPARMWPHKNHVALVRALAILERRDCGIHCVFTDDQTEHAAVVRQVAEDEGVAERILCLGRVDPETMSALYQRCLMVVVPSLFEQSSGPMLEAIHFERPVAVSNLPEHESTLDGRGLVFDARSPEAIADTLDRFLGSETVQAEATEQIRELKGRLSWEPFREVYRRAFEWAAGR